MILKTIKINIFYFNKKQQIHLLKKIVNFLSFFFFALDFLLTNFFLNFIPRYAKNFFIVKNKFK